MSFQKISNWSWLRSCWSFLMTYRKSNSVVNYIYWVCWVWERIAKRQIISNIWVCLLVLFFLFSLWFDFQTTFQSTDGTNHSQYTRKDHSSWRTLCCLWKFCICFLPIRLTNQYHACMLLSAHNYSWCHREKQQNTKLPWFAMILQIQATRKARNGLYPSIPPC